MARKAESVLRTRVKEALRPLHVVPVENGETDPGTPDVNYGGTVKWHPATGLWESWKDPSAIEGWMELKRGLVQQRSSSRVAITEQPGQKPWWETRSRAGGRIHVLVELYPERLGRLPGFLWLEGSVATRLLNVASLSTLIEAAGRGYWCSNHRLEWACWLRTCLLM